MKLKNALIVIDMQKDFVDGALGTKEAQELVPRINQRIAAYRNMGLVDGSMGNVYYTADTHHEDYLLTLEGRKLPIPHCIKGESGWEFTVNTGECQMEEQWREQFVFEKNTFGSIGLAQKIRAEGYASIELCGVCTDICVISNAAVIKAFCPETDIYVNPKLCAGTTPEAHANAISVMRQFQINIVEEE